MLPVSVPELGRVMNSDLGLKQTVASVSPEHTCLDTALTPSFAVHLWKGGYIFLGNLMLYRTLGRSTVTCWGEPTKPKT